MKKDRNELKAGIFIILAFLLALAVVMRIRDARLGAVQTRTVAFKLTDDLGGLRVGDEVRLGGYKVGTVDDIHPAGLETNNPRMLVQVSLPAEYTLHPNAVVGVQSGLTGAVNVNIQSVGSGPTLKSGEALVGKPDPKSSLFASIGNVGPHLESAMARIDQETVPKVNQTVDAAKSLISHANEKVDPIVERYNKVADNAAGAAAEVKDLMGDTKPDLRGTIKNLNSATGTIKDKLPGLIDQITAAITKVDKSLTTTQSALEDIQKTAANAKDLTGSLRSLIVGNRSKFDTMIASVKTTSDNLKGASIEIRRSPWRLLYKPTPAEAANLNLYDSAREFAEGANSMSDAAGALRDALHDPQADRAQIQKLIEDLDRSFGHFHQVEDKLWVTAR
jgi:ABC-type transporter Mla subunit MlaD